MSALGRWPLIRGNLTLNGVGTLTKCPYTAGGRSRRGSPKAGTTVSADERKREERKKTNQSVVNGHNINQFCKLKQ